MTIQQEILIGLLKKFPNHGKKTVARIAFKENPSVFTSLKAAYACALRLAGAAGTASSNCGVAWAKRPHGKSGTNAFGKIPEGLTHFEEWRAVQFNEPMKCLILSDLHIPYHEKDPIITALRYGKKVDCDTVLLNGDVADFFSVSFWEKDPRKRKFAEELKTVQAFMVALRECLPNARIIYKVGNHEERWDRYMMLKAPELLGIPEFKLHRILKVKEKDLIQEKRPIRLGKLNVLHGHEYRFAISNPVNPARGLFLRCKAHALCGHFHQSSYHSSKTVEQKNVACWSAGCLCDLHPDYAVFNEWSHGFAIVETDKAGEFEVQNKYIANGRVF